MPSISYAITACNEHVELERLLSQLTEHIRPEDEITVQMDITATDEVKAISNKYKLMNYFHPLNNDFATFKNNLNSLCTKDYIFQIDADEMPSLYLIQYLPILLENNDVEVLRVPRVNTVKGLTQEHIQKWGWVVDSKSRVNWPDLQWRIYKNTPEIKWKNKVHEILDGYKTHAILPLEEHFALEHHKDIERQEKQNAYYENL